MASDSADAHFAPLPRHSSVLLLLRLEGLAVATGTTVLYAHTGASWGLFAALWLAPDLSMLGYLANSCWGARSYNTAHTYVVPAVLALSAMLLHGSGMLLAIALIWINHIGVDRLLGYGLKFREGFGWTHLGRVGKQRSETTPAGPVPA
jgi:hypothetical protein